MTNTSRALVGPVFVAGHRGVVGSAIVRALAKVGATAVVRERGTLDLADGEAAAVVFREVRPAVVFLAAGRVGGILENRRHPVEMAHENALISGAVMRAAHQAGVARLISIGSACMYPVDAPQPLEERSLLSGPPESTNRAYAAAKRFAAELSWAYHVEHGSRFLTVVSANVYGPAERSDPDTAHVVPALARRMAEARDAGAGSVTVWGTGRPTRDLVHADDVAEACLHLAALPDADFDGLLDPTTIGCVNVGTGRETSIAALAALIAATVGFRGRIVWDPAKPDGAPRRVVDATRIRATGWAPRIPLPDGLRATYGMLAPGRSAP